MGKQKDFVAIDVETANNNEDICQIGICVVKDGIKQQPKVWMVQPPGNHYDKGQIKKHHITPDMTENSPVFDVVWEEVKEYLIGQILVAHNHHTEIRVLNKHFDKYGIMPMGINMDILCTCEMHEGKNLKAVCQAYGLTHEDHHNAGFDADRCAQFYLNYLNGVAPDWSLVTEEPKKKSQPKKRKGDIKSVEVNEMETIADENSPFYNRNIVVTGDFYIRGEEVNRSDIKIKLRVQYGAWLKDNISGKVHFALIGENPGPKKMNDIEEQAYNGINIRKLFNYDLENIMKGEWDGYHVSEEVMKDLNLTYEHFTKKCMTFNNGYNIIAGKEMFQGKGLSGDRDLFAQITGNLGAHTDYRMLPETNLCVLSDSTLEKLKAGKKDDTIVYIEACYNSSKARTFELSFISESEILSFAQYRFEHMGDESTGYYYRRYIGEIEKED